MNPENRVIAVHHSPDTGFLDSLPESRKVYLVEGSLIHIRTCVVTAPFLVVGREMLDSGDHAFRLHSFNIMFRHLRGQVRILTEIFKVSAVHRCSVDVYTGSKEDSHSSGLGILSKSVSEPFGKFSVPSGGRKYSGRIKGAGGIIAYALRTVRHSYFRNSKPVHTTQNKGCGRTDVITLLFKSHFRHQLPSPGIALFRFRHIIHIVTTVRNGRQKKKWKCQ